MFKFSERSKKNLSEAHEHLQILFNEVIKYYDCAIICGHRGEEEQDEAYSSGRSDKLYPDSKHNRIPSLAVDAVPWFKDRPHIRWEDKVKFYHFSGFVLAIAATLGIKVRWGGNWDMDDELHDQRLYDLCHFELIV